MIQIIQQFFQLQLLIIINKFQTKFSYNNQSLLSLIHNIIFHIKRPQIQLIYNHKIIFNFNLQFLYYPKTHNN